MEYLKLEAMEEILIRSWTVKVSYSVNPKQWKMGTDDLMDSPNDVSFTNGLCTHSSFMVIASSFVILINGSSLFYHSMYVE